MREPGRKGLFPALLVSWVHHSPHTALLLISAGYNPSETHCLVCGFLSPKGIVPVVCSGSPQGVQSKSLKYSTNYLTLIHRNSIIWIPDFIWAFTHFSHFSRPWPKYPLPSSDCPLDMSPWQSLCLLPSAPNFILGVLCEQLYQWRLLIEQELSVQWEHSHDPLLKDYSSSPAASWGPILCRRSADMADRTQMSLVTLSRWYLKANFLSSCFVGNILWSRLHFPGEKSNHAQKLL